MAAGSPITHIGDFHFMLSARIKKTVAGAGIAAALVVAGASSASASPTSSTVTICSRGDYSSGIRVNSSTWIWASPGQCASSSAPHTTVGIYAAFWDGTKQIGTEYNTGTFTVTTYGTESDFSHVG